MKKAALWLSIIWTAIIMLSVLYVSSNKKAEVVHFAAVDRDGYEDSPAQVRVSAPYSLKWKQASGLGKVVGFIFLGAMWVAVWYVATDRHLGKHTGDASAEQAAVKGKSILGQALPFACIVLSGIFLFSSYSSSLDLGSVVMSEVAWQSIKDNPDAIMALFVK